MLIYIFSAVIGYLIGSVSFAVVICKLFYFKDIRKKGSGNAGATNAARVFGPVAGVLTFLGDFLKGIAAMYIAKALGGETAMVVGGIACLLGHCFPLYFHFKGGKAVSTGASVAFMVDWRFFVIVIVVFILFALLTKRVSIGSIVAALSLVVLSFAFAVSVPLKILSVVACALIVFMHRENIKRIRNGTEPAFTFGKTKKPGENNEENDPS